MSDRKNHGEWLDEPRGSLCLWWLVIPFGAALLLMLLVAAGVVWWVIRSSQSMASAPSPEDDLEVVVGPVIGPAAERAPEKPAPKVLGPRLELPPDGEDVRAKPVPEKSDAAIPIKDLAPSVQNSIGMKLNLVPAGTFLMGSHESIEQLRKDFDLQFTSVDDEFPAHQVTLRRHYYMGVYEVTQEEYEKVMGKNPSHFAATGSKAKSVAGVDTRRFPVEGVAWRDAVAFCRKLSELPAERDAGRIYRLPTEAEWEYACRGGDRPPSRYFFGASDAEVKRYGWISPYFIDPPHPVGQLLPNPLGLYDMLGNIREWCEDVYSESYYSEIIGADPTGPPATPERQQRVVRYGPRCSQRSGVSPGASAMIGFRVVFTATRPADAPQKGSN